MTPEGLNQAFSFNAPSLEFLNFISLIALLLWHAYVLNNYMELKKKFEKLNIDGGDE